MKKTLAIRFRMIYNIPCVRKKEKMQNALLAQLVEHLTLNQVVQGSRPWRRIIKGLNLQT